MDKITPPTPTFIHKPTRPRQNHHHHHHIIHWVDPPSPTEQGYDLRQDTEGRWVLYRWKSGKRHWGGSTRIEPFFKRWPPSRTSAEDCAWICVDRGRGPRAKAVAASTTTNPEPSPVPVGGGGDLDALQREFRELVKSGITATTTTTTTTGTAMATTTTPTTQPPKTYSSIITPEQIDGLAKKYNVLSGKWMIHTKSSQVDLLWRRVVGVVCFDRHKGRAKVSTRENGDDSHIICVYVNDYTNRQDVDALREALRSKAGVTWMIGFKPDLYTFLGVYRGNEWGLRPSRYHDSDVGEK